MYEMKCIIWKMHLKCDEQEERRTERTGAPYVLNAHCASTPIRAFFYDAPPLAGMSSGAACCPVTHCIWARRCFALHMLSDSIKLVFFTITFHLACLPNSVIATNKLHHPSRHHHDRETMIVSRVRQFCGATLATFFLTKQKRMPDSSCSR